MIEDLERELAAAMADDVAMLPAPQLDLTRMHRTPVRRYVVPGAVVAVGVAPGARPAVAKPGTRAPRPPPHSGVRRTPPLPVQTPAVPLPKLTPPPTGKHSLPAPPVSLPSVPAKLPVHCTITQRSFRTDE